MERVLRLIIAKRIAWGGLWNAGNADGSIDSKPVPCADFWRGDGIRRHAKGLLREIGRTLAGLLDDGGRSFKECVVWKQFARQGLPRRIGQALIHVSYFASARSMTAGILSRTRLATIRASQPVRLHRKGLPRRIGQALIHGSYFANARSMTAGSLSRTRLAIIRVTQPARRHIQNRAGLDAWILFYERGR